MTAYQVGQWIVHPDLNQMTCGETVTPLEPRVLALLTCFAENPGRVLNRDDLIEKAWDGVIVSESTINHTVGVLRRVLGDKAKDPRYIQTVAKKGYRLVAPVSDAPDIETIAAAPSIETVPVPTSNIYKYAAAMLVFLSVSVGLLYTSKPTPTQNLLFKESKPLTSLRGQESSPELGPAGQWLYFSYIEKDAQFSDIYKKPLDGGMPEPVLTPSPNSHETSPAISHDGKRLAYARFDDAGCTIFLHHLNEDKTDEELASCGPYAPRLDWTPNGNLLFAGASSRRTPSRIKRIDIDSGKIIELTDADSGVGDYTFALSHDGARIAYLRTTHWNHSDLIMMDVATGEEELLRQFPTWFFDIAWTADNRSIIYAPEPSQRALEAIDTETGKFAPIYNQSKGMYGYRSLRSGNKLIATERSWDTNIYKAKLRSGHDALQIPTSEPLVASTRSDWQPRPAPDAKNLAFLSDRTGNQEIWASDTEGRNARQLSHLDGQTQVHVFSWNHQSSLITFDGYDDRVYVLDINTGIHKAITPEAMMARNPTFSQDGSHILFTSLADKDWQIWSIPTAGGTPTQVTQKGGFSAKYGNDGSLYVTKYYKDGLWKVDTKTGKETLVVPNMITGPMQQWNIREEGVYYLNNQIGRAQIFFYDWSRKQAELLHDMPHIGFTFELSVDGKDILFTRDDSRASDIVMIQ